MRWPGRATALIGILGLLQAIAGCNRVPDAPESANPVYFPLNAHWVWQYQVTSEISGGRQKEKYWVRNQGPIEWVDGASAMVRRDSRGNQYLLRGDRAGIVRLASRDELATKWRPDPNQPRRFVLRHPVEAGTYWQVESVSYFVRANADMPREPPGGKRLLMGFEIVDTNASVQVPAGQFNQCLLVVGKASFRVYADGLKGYRDVPVMQREWYCPQIGMVRLERTEQVSTPQYRGGATTFELLSVRR